MNHIQHHNRSYTGDLKFNRVITVSGQATTVSAWVATLHPLVRTKFTIGNHLVRLLVLWKSADAKEPRKVLVTNRIYWEAHRILKVYKATLDWDRARSPGREAASGHG